MSAGKDALLFGRKHQQQHTDLILPKRAHPQGYQNLRSERFQCSRQAQGHHYRWQALDLQLPGAPGFVESEVWPRVPVGRYCVFEDYRGGRMQL